MSALTSRAEFRIVVAAAFAFIALGAGAPADAVQRASGLVAIANEIDTDSIKAFCEGKRQKFEAPLLICPIFNRPPPPVFPF